MGFKADQFITAEFQHRTDAVRVPGLAEWFDGDPVWTVRGLTAHEFATCQEAAEKDQSVAALAEALAAGTKNEQVKELRDALGLSDTTPGEISKRIRMLMLGSVDPVCDRELSVKLSERYPIEFYQLTNEITQLTGKGQIVGKPDASGDGTT